MKKPGPMALSWPPEAPVGPDMTCPHALRSDLTVCNDKKELHILHSHRV